MARHGERGFTLVEVLVALAIVGMVLGTVYRLYGTGVMAVGRGASQLELALAAEALLERTRADLDPRGAGIEGRLADGTRFRVTAQPTPPRPVPRVPGADDGDGPPDAEPDPDRPRDRLWLVRVEVADESGRVFALSTYRWFAERAT